MMSPISEPTKIDVARDQAYLTLLTEIGKNHKALIASDHPDAGQLINLSLKQLGFITRQISRLSKSIAKHPIAKGDK